ncbi:pentapeptide repeat-containing protein, partial [bacterium]|nr:pentapeptide repeat-containing protein [bacterium]
MAQTATGAFKSAIGRLSGIQREKVPVKPELSSPLSIVKSLFGADVVHDDTIELLKDIVVSLKADRLNDPKDLSKVGLFEANLHGADLSGADLSGAKLDEANLGDANLSNTNLGEAKLNGANLSGAVLVGA